MTKPNFSIEVREQVSKEQYGKCFFLTCDKPIKEIHHIVQNTIMYRKIYHELIQSRENAVGLCREHHKNIGWLVNTKHALLSKWPAKSKLNKLSGDRLLIYDIIKLYAPEPVKQSFLIKATDVMDLPGILKFLIDNGYIEETVYHKYKTLK